MLCRTILSARLFLCLTSVSYDLHLLGINILIKIHPIPAFDDNYIWAIIDTDSHEACVVDPGDAAAVSNYLKQEQLNLHAILITHHHFDHTGGIDELLKQGDVPVYGPDNVQISSISHPLKAGNEITLLDCRYSIIEVPGHTLDHIAYFCAKPPQATTLANPVLFCGDTLFAGGCGRIFEGTAKQMWESLNKLSALPTDTAVYCTHEYTLANLAFALAVEPSNKILQERNNKAKAKRANNEVTLPSSIKLERASNPFLRVSEQCVIDAAIRHSGNTMADAVDVFTTIRAWKDSY